MNCQKDASNESTMKPNNNPAEKAEEEETDQFNMNAPSTPEPINRKLDFDEENSPASNKSSNEINMYGLVILNNYNIMSKI